MSGARILVVEDEGIIAINIKHKLENLGYEVADIVDTGGDAIKTAEETEPDLILMDIVLKGDMDGIEAAQQINSSMDIPVIYLTAYSNDEVLNRARITEPYGYILKPFTKGELKSNIEMALYKHESEMKKSKIIKKKVLADFYDFVLDAMPSSAEHSDREVKKMLLNVFAERLEEDLRPNFDQEMKNLEQEGLSGDGEAIFDAYLTWISDLFSSFGIPTKISSYEHGYILEFLKCPWIEEAKNKPMFCLNCQAMMNRSFSWTDLQGNVDRKATIADGSPSCIYRFFFSPLE